MNTFFAHTTLRLKSRTLSLPWLRSVHSSSAAIVRCAQNDPQVPVSLSSLRKKKNKGVINIDSDLKRPISVCEKASESRIPKTVKSNESNRGRKKEINKNELQSVEQVAIELLAARAFSISELRKKLLGKKFPLDVVNKVIVDLKDRGLVNDGLYAETFSRSRWLSVTWGPRRIKQALIQKGISEAEVDKATKKVFESDDNENDNANTEHNNKEQTMSQSSMDRLFIQASKQWLKGGQDLSSQNRKGRIIRWLQYRGFNWSVISVILTRLQSQYCNVNDNHNNNNNNNNNNNKTKSDGVSKEKETKELSEEGLDKLFGEVSKLWIKGQDLPMEKRKARIIRWLQYRGHKWDVVGDMLERLKSKFPP